MEQEEKQFNPTLNTSKEKKRAPMIMCVGMGGGGTNICNYMHERNIQGVTLVVMNTDQQALDNSPIPNRIILGPSVTKGLGAGAKPEIGEAAANESKEEISRILHKDIKMLFIVSGLGGGTGSYSSSVIAKLAKEKGMLVIGVVTTPFKFEGKKKHDIAEAAIAKLEEYCDTMIIIENEKLMQNTEEMKNLSLKAAFCTVDQILYEAVTAITDSITNAGKVNVDLRDVETMVKNAGYAVIGIGLAEGENRGLKAVKNALNSHLLRYSNIQGATRFLLNISSGPEGEFTLQELIQVTNYIKEVLSQDGIMDDNLMVIWGHSYSKKLAEKIQVSIVASGFPDRKLSSGRARNMQKNEVFKKGYGQQSAKNPLSDRTPYIKSRTSTERKTLAEKIQHWNKHGDEVTWDPEIETKEEMSDKERKRYESEPAYRRKAGFSFDLKPRTQEAPKRHELGTQEE